MVEPVKSAWGFKQPYGEWRQTVFVNPMWREEIEAGAREHMWLRGCKVEYHAYVPAYAPIGRQPLWKRLARALRIMKPPKLQPQAFVYQEPS